MHAYYNDDYGYDDEYDEDEARRIEEDLMDDYDFLGYDDEYEEDDEYDDF